MKDTFFLFNTNFRSFSKKYIGWFAQLNAVTTKKRPENQAFRKYEYTDYIPPRPFN